MLIRILTSRGGHPCGAEVEIDDAVAQEWLAVGDAEPVQTSAQAPTAAERLPLETAMRPKAKGR